VGAVAPAWPEEEFGGIPAEVPEPPSAPLTPRELEVLLLAANGHSGPAIANDLVVSLGTVRKHFENLYKKLDVSDRPAAVAKALRLGLIL
jgi:LuxR family maltose regulon positive regulatory protein